MSKKNANPPQAGDVAPDFTLRSTGGSSVTLSSFRGHKNVLLAFFPMAFTGVCTAQLCGLSDDFDSLSASNVEVFPISVDAVPSLKEFRRKYDMKVHLLSDFKREVSRSYGVLNEAAFFSERAYFLIDRDGVVKWAHVEDTIEDRRENAEIRAAVESLTA